MWQGETITVSTLTGHDMQFEGRHIRVDLAAGVSKSIRGGGKNVLYDPGKSVFLGNLPFDITVSLHGSLSFLMSILEPAAEVVGSLMSTLLS